MNPNATYALASAELIDGKLRFDSSDGFARAIADGFFFVKSPSLTWQPAIPSPATSTCLARRASARPTRVSRSGPKIGWRAGKDISPATSTRSSSSSSRADSGRQCSQALCCGRPNGCGVSVSRCCGPYCGTGPAGRAVDEATGRCLSMQGTYHLTFNHFRSHVRARGLNVHKDSGWVTILRSLEPGLEVLREETGCRSRPVPANSSSTSAARWRY